jgi:hypothetical protein
MADLAKILRDGVARIDDITKSAQATVTLIRWAGEDNYGAMIPSTPITLPAIVDLRAQDRPSPSGQMVRTGAQVFFLQPLAPLGGILDRTEPIDTRDTIILPDGTTGPIIEVSGFVDAGTAAPYFHEIWLGARTRTTA